MAVVAAAPTVAPWRVHLPEGAGNLVVGANWAAAEHWAEEAGRLAVAGRLVVGEAGGAEPAAALV